MICYRIVYLTGPKKGRRITVEKGDLMIGSDADSHVRIQDLSVQPRHAILEQRATGCWIRAGHESAHVQVNDLPVTEKQLAHGDEIDIGNQRLLFQLCGGNPTASKRRRSKFHGMTFVAVWAVLFTQVLILAGLFAFWRIDPIPDPPPEINAALQQRLSEFSAAQAENLSESYELIPVWIVTPVWEPTSTTQPEQDVPSLGH